MKLLGVFLSKAGERVSVCVCFLWQMCVMYFPDLTRPKLWLWPGRVIRAAHKKPFSSVQYTDFGKIHCVFQHVQKIKKNTREAEVCTTITQEQRRVTFS